MLYTSNLVLLRFKDAKPKVDCKRKDTSKTGDDNEMQNCCDYTPMCSGCFETCCYPGFYWAGPLFKLIF